MPQMGMRVFLCTKKHTQAQQPFKFLWNMPGSRRKVSSESNHFEKNEVNKTFAKTNLF
jgi:hypothetical protein